MRPSVGQHAARLAAELLARTWHLEVHGEDRLAEVRRVYGRVVFAVWHGHILPPLWHRRGQGIALLVSAHRDGRYLASAARRWGYVVHEGSSTRGGHAGLRGIVRALRQGGDAAFAPDGPRGPTHRVKPGAVAAARLARAALVPVAIDADRGWQTASWDRMLIPAPGSSVRIVYGDPVDAQSVTAADALENALFRTEEQARW